MRFSPHAMTRWLAAILLVSVAPNDLGATTVRELNLLALERAAGSIFHGRCLGRKEVAGDPVPYTEYRFEVLSAVKGCRDAAGRQLRTLTFRHVGTRQTFVRPDGTRVVPLRLGVPAYAVGEEVVLFLTRESGIGLCAPVGLHQGKFSVIRGDGAARVRNRLANAGLFEPVEAGAFEAGAEALLTETRRRPARLELQRLLELCRRVKR